MKHADGWTRREVDYPNLVVMEEIRWDTVTRVSGTGVGESIWKESLSEIVCTVVVALEWAWRRRA